ncbi:MAG: N-ethylmaleimide reductase [Gammaproteobacteria bacterium]|jgi:N-ethylmaleimide reductase
MKTSNLFEPITVGNHQLKHRVALAPLTRGRAGPERIANDLMAEYYFQRFSAALMISEATVISEQANGWVNSPGIYTQEMVEGWKKVTEKVKPSNTPFFLQLWHCGRASHSDFHNGELPVSASAVKLEGDGINTPLGKKPYETPRALSVAEIEATVNDYRKAAINAKEAGFSGVEVHSANGYLINQFLDSKTNHRDDQYGGTIENRYRLLKEVLAAVMEVWSPEQVAVRLSPNGVFNDMGSEDFREIFLYAAKELDKLNLAYLHIMDGLAFGFHEKGEPMTLAEFRAVYHGVIVANCGYTQESAEQTIAEGGADIIAFGRPFITNPDLPERFKNDWPLTPFEDMSTWYTSEAEGYTNYPSFESS